MYSTTTLLAVFIVVIYAIRKYLAFREAVRIIQDHPGPRLILSPWMGLFLPKIKYFTAGSNYAYEDKHDKFAAAGWDIYVTIHALPAPNTTVYLADADTIKEVANSRARFPKPVYHYGVLSFYGDNIVASEGEQWKKYRKIAAPAFSERNYKLVWDETLEIVKGLCDDHWGGRKVVEVDNFDDTALAMTLYIISGAGFGKKISWKDDLDLPEGHLMSFKESMRVVTADLMFKIVFPNWMMNLTKRLRRAKLAFEELRSYMVEMIEERQQTDNTNRHDLFTGLLEENKNTFEPSMLTEDELIGNLYLFLIAGHETTGHTLAFTFALLALYPDEQEKLFQHIRSVVPEGQEPSYSNMNLLTYVTAILYETTRMHTVITQIPKTTTEDTSLNCSNANGDQISVVVPKGADIIIMSSALHYNPRYWEDPHSFKPERFLKKDWPRHAFIPFSAGPRSCLGRKFFETEAVAAVAVLVSRYKITIKEEPKFANETFPERKARVLACGRYITTVPNRIPLVFTRRA